MCVLVDPSEYYASIDELFDLSAAPAGALVYVEGEPVTDIFSDDEEVAHRRHVGDVPRVAHDLVDASGSKFDTDVVTDVLESNPHPVVSQESGRGGTGPSRREAVVLDIKGRGDAVPNRLLSP